MLPAAPSGALDRVRFAKRVQYLAPRGTRAATSHLPRPSLPSLRTAPPNPHFKAGLSNVSRCRPLPRTDGQAAMPETVSRERMDAQLSLTAGFMLVGGWNSARRRKHHVRAGLPRGGPWAMSRCQCIA